MPFDNKGAMAAQSLWLQAIGLADHEEVVGTPKRVAEFWADKLISGHAKDPIEELGSPLETTSKGIVSINDIPFHSVCPHHLVPYFGVVNIAYQPSGHILGLGKFEQFVAACSRRLILQETLTTDLACLLAQHIDARGVMVRVHAQHLCFILNGREPRDATLTTWHGLGSLESAYDLFSTASTR